MVIFTARQSPNASDHDSVHDDGQAFAGRTFGHTPRGWKEYIGEELRKYAAEAIPTESEKERACLRVISQIFGRESVVNGEHNKIPSIALIGGWATYAKSGLRKSHDIDVVASFAGWDDLKAMAYENGWKIGYNPALKKHEIKAKDGNTGVEVDIDVYVAHKDEGGLLIPPQDILNRFSVMRALPYVDQQVRIISTTALLAMKIELSLRASRLKDAVDVAGLVTLVSPAPDMHEVGKILHDNLPGKSVVIRECLNHFTNLMDKLVEGTIVFRDVSEQERAKQLVAGLALELKEGAFTRNDGLLRGAIGDIFSK